MMMAELTFDTAPDVMTVPEAAVLLRVSADSLYRAIGRGEFPGAKIGSRYLVGKAAILAWLAEKSQH